MYVYIHLHYMFICMHVLIEGRKGYPELVGELELQVILGHSLWVLGLKLGPPRRARTMSLISSCYFHF